MNFRGKAMVLKFMKVLKVATESVEFEEFRSNCCCNQQVEIFVAQSESSSLPIVNISCILVQSFGILEVVL